MISPDQSRRRALARAFVLNAVPVVGVLALDWSLLALLLIYWFELGVNLVVAVVEGVVAEYPPMYDDSPTETLLFGALVTKRGGIPLPGTQAMLRPANLPPVFAAIVGFGLVWAITGSIGIGGAGMELPESEIDRAAGSALLGFLAVFVTRIGEGVAYFWNREYTNVPVGDPLRSALVPIMGVGTAMLFAGMAATVGAPAWGILLAVIGVKLLGDLANIYRDRLIAFDRTDDIELGFAVEYEDWPPLETTFETSPTNYRSHPGAVVLNGVTRGLQSPVLLVLGVFIGLFTILGITTNSVGLLVLMGNITAWLLLLAAVVGVVDRSLRYLLVTYDVAGGVLARDRVLGPQWRLDTEQLATATTHQTRIDRWFDTETIIVETGDRTYKLPHLPKEAIPSAGGV
ncbi:DUF6498-containing protein [Halosegnis longus]|uniref:DUF6498-containing protein n=1 Tax=Halosegnis longus TaxID=2216012 RepID=UPI00117CF639|nr:MULTISPECIES: DUF6498-containing protein [Halobacteriales]